MWAFIKVLKKSTSIFGASFLCKLSSQGPIGPLPRAKAPPTVDQNAPPPMGKGPRAPTAGMSTDTNVHISMHHRRGLMKSTLKIQITSLGDADAANRDLIVTENGVSAAIIYPIPRLSFRYFL